MPENVSVISSLGVLEPWGFTGFEVNVLLLESDVACIAGIGHRVHS